MCKSCGCPAQGSSQVKFLVRGVGEDNVKQIEKSLLGLPGVYFISINNLDGLTTVFYNPSRTTLTAITDHLAGQGVQALV